MPLIIRPAVPADAGTIVEFNCRLALETESKTLNGPTITRGVQALLADPAKGFYTVAEDGGAVIGQTLITMEWSDWRNGWFWWIQSVYVQAEHRSRGVFTALFEHLKAKAIAQGDVIGIRLYFEKDNHKAKAVYQKLGLTDTDYGMLEMYPLE
jgi:GNAT superfamily N-acetyltransferase